MPETPKKELTCNDAQDIILTNDERRIIFNLRRVAQDLFHNGDIHTIFKVHQDEVKYGLIQLGDNVIRL